MDKKIFSERLVTMRKELGLSQTEFAKQIGTTRTTLSGYELGNYLPDAEILSNMANIFNCPIDYLLGRSDIKSPNISDTEINKRFGLGRESIDNLEYRRSSHTAYNHIIDKFIGHEKFPSFITSISAHIDNKRKFAVKNHSEEYMDFVIAKIFADEDIFDYISDPENIIDGSARKIERIVEYLIDDLVEKEINMTEATNDAEAQINP